MDNQHLYLDKANEVCRNIFEKEYFNSLGIPLPEIKFIQPDSANFKTGEYYIRIGDTWQIHLNFGLLPPSILEFAEEVKVLTRHEVEHYQTCPFDVLTHFRMLKVIVDTYNAKFSGHKIDINKLGEELDYFNTLNIALNIQYATNINNQLHNVNLYLKAFSWIIINTI